jgi:hypothetical protein
MIGGLAVEDPANCQQKKTLKQDEGCLYSMFCRKNVADTEP